MLIEPPKDDTEHGYPVERVLGHKIVKGKDYCYYIDWKGHPVEDNSWQRRENLTPEALKSWEDSIKNRSVARNSQAPRNPRTYPLFFIAHN